MPVMKRGVSPVTGIDSSNDIPDVGTFDASGALDMLPMLVSIYKNAAARKEGTQQFLEAMAHLAQKYQVPHLQEAAEWLASRFPRVAAHMTGDPVLNPQTYDAAIKVPRGQVTAPMPFKISPSGLKTMRESPEVAKALVSHEATHAAQALGNSDMLELYHRANSITGYQKNPFELAAFKRQAEFAPQTVDRPIIQSLSTPTNRAKNVMQQLEEIAVRGGQEGKAVELRKLLRQRLGREPMAVSHTRTIP